jgi:hypothetical protein
VIDLWFYVQGLKRRIHRTWCKNKIIQFTQWQLSPTPMNEEVLKCRRSVVQIHTHWNCSTWKSLSKNQNVNASYQDWKPTRKIGSCMYAQNVKTGMMRWITLHHIIMNIPNAISVTMRETLTKILGREPTLRECQAYLKWVRLVETYPEIVTILALHQSWHNFSYMQD